MSPVPQSPIRFSVKQKFIIKLNLNPYGMINLVSCDSPEIIMRPREQIN